MTSLLTSTSEVLQSLFVEGSIVRPHEHLNVWKIKEPSQLGLRRSSAQYRQQKKQLLAKFLCEFSGCYLDYSENPIDDGLPGQWERAGDIRWMVPADVAVGDFYEWLYLGNWGLFKLETGLGLDDPIGLVANGPEEIIDTMRRNGVVAYLSAYHDNDPWTIAVNHGEQPNRPSLSSSQPTKKKACGN